MFESAQKSEKENQSDHQSESQQELDQTSSSEFKSKSENKLQAYQLKADQQNQNSPEAVIQKKSNENNTGLPNELKTGVEKLSGKSMDDVKVHYNSDSPSKLGAHAYAQGTDIHLGKGQEKHLPHEAWHVVQQKEGRVKPSVQKKKKIGPEDESALENEADSMGGKAIKESNSSSDVEFSNKPIQKKLDEQEEDKQEEGEVEQENQEQTAQETTTAEETPSNTEDESEKESSASIEIKPETLVLSGKKGLYAKISSVFGKETSFGKLLNLVKEYETLEDDQKKSEISAQIVAEGKHWLDKHPEEKAEGKGFFGRMKMGFNRLRGKTQNDTKKRESISLIVKRFEESEDPSSVNLTTLEDKQSLTSKIKGAFGFKTTFKQIEEKYHVYQSKASSSITKFSELKSVLNEASSIISLISDWKTSHEKDNDETGESKRASLVKIEQGLANLFIEANLKNIVQVKISKLNVSSESNEVVTAQTIDLKINLEGKELSGHGKNVEIREGGINFKEIEIKYDDDIKISEDLEVSKPVLKVSQNGENYNIHASGGVKLGMEIPNVAISASGHVEVDYSTQTKGFHSPVLKGGAVTASMFNENLVISADTMNYENGVFTAEKGEATLKLFGFKTEVSNLSYSKSGGIDWSSIRVNINKEFKAGDIITVKSPEALIQGKSAKYAYDIIGDVGLSVNLPASSTLTTNGKVTVSGVPNESNYDKKVENVDFDLKIGENLHASASGVNYDKGTDTMSAAETFLELSLFNKKLSSKVDDLKVSKEGIDWEIATFKTERLGLDDLITVKDLVATAKGKKGGYEKHAEGTVEMGSDIVPGAEINATGLRAGMTMKDGKWSFDVVGEQLSVSLLNKKLVLSSNNLKYKNKKLEMETVGISVNLPTGTITGEGTGVVIDKTKVDWNEIKFKLPSILPNIGSLKFNNGDVILKGKSEEYALGLDVGASIEKGDWFSASGKASLLWNYQKDNFPKVKSYQMIFGVQSPKIPDAFIPPGANGAWPISFGLTMPFAAGPVPMEAEVQFGAEAGANIGITGTVSKVGELTSISGLGNAKANLEVWIRGSLGVGSKYALKLAGFLEGRAKAEANLNIGLEGQLDQEFNFNSLVGNYVADAAFIASLNAGIEAKALVVFQKTLYEVTLKKWELGSSQKAGTFDFINNEDQDTATTGLFKGAEIGENDLQSPPDVEHNTKEYLLALSKFNQLLKEENPSQSIEEISAEESIFGEAQITSKKSKLMKILQDSIAENLSNKEYKKFTTKLKNDQANLEKKKKKHQEEMENQYVYLKKAENNNRSYFAMALGRNVDYYTARIERLKNDYKNKVEKDLVKLNKNLSKVSIYQNQIDSAEIYIQNIDPILQNPETGLAEIEIQIQKYKQINTEANEQKYSINNYLLDEEIGNKDIDYEKDDQSLSL